MRTVYDEVKENFTDKLFMDGESMVSALENEAFIERIYTKFMEYLQAHKLRNIVFDKLLSS